MPCDWEGSRRSGVALAMRHRLKWFIRLRAHGLDREMSTPAYALLWSMARLPYLQKTGTHIKMLLEGRLVYDQGPYVLYGSRTLQREGGLYGTCTWHPHDTGRVPSSRPPDATSSTQQGRHAAAMRTVATTPVANFSSATIRHQRDSGVCCPWVSSEEQQLSLPQPLHNN